MTDTRTGLAYRVLGNGVPVLFRHRPRAAVTTVSLWVLRGSRHETVPGITHLLEHVLMQAVPAGRTQRVVDELESYGAEANAITARDHLVLYARVPTTEAGAALRLLAEALTNRDFPADLVAAECQVVDEELRLAALDPNDVVHDVFFQTAFGSHPIGRPVGGAVGGLAGVRPPDLVEWARRHLNGGLVAAVVVGDLDPDLVAELLEFGPLGALPPGDGEPPSGEDGPVVATGRLDLQMDSDTAAVVLGGPGYPLTHPDLPVAEVVLELLAGSKASVLNEEIQSARGLSYDVWGTATGYRDTGAWRAGFSTAPDRYAEVAELAAKLIMGAVTHGWTEDEVAVARRRVAGLLLLDSESSLDDVLLLGRYALVGGDREWSPERHAEALAAVTASDVSRCARAMLAGLVMVSVGGAPPQDIGHRVPPGNRAGGPAGQHDGGPAGKQDGGSAGKQDGSHPEAGNRESGG